MKILLLTQKIDQTDSLLGFFTNWVIEFARQTEKVTVICLERGPHDLTVPVFSLGKETSLSRFKYLVNFYRLIIRERHNYDTVFAHMNQEYVLLGAVIWKLLGKKVYLWRNHPSGGWLTRLAVLLSDRVFCTSDQSFTARFKKTEIMPAGIDTNIFKPPAPDFIRLPQSVLYLGRISSIKKVETIISGLNILADQSIKFIARFYGAGLDLPKEKIYYQTIRKQAEGLEKAGLVEFLGVVPNTATPAIYQSHEILINTTPTGSFDKVILEMMASGGLVLISNQSFGRYLSGDLQSLCLAKEADVEDLARKLEILLTLSVAEKQKLGQKLHEVVVAEHSLKSLVTKVVNRK